ncbi:MAG: DMT family transporter [Alphaproteobacteria bacterium]|nr:DMT family transporter [Alphaproteobacteria bacterium]
MSLTPFGDALSKQLGDTQSPFVIVFLRYFTAGLIALVIARATKTPIRIPTQDRGGMVVRTALVMAAMTLLIIALSMIPLANAVGGFLIAPIVAILLSVRLYRERLSWPRIAGAFASFLGAILILQPAGGVDTGTLYALLGGVCLGAFLALSRGAAAFGNPVSALAVQCLLGSAMLAPLALPQITTVGATVFLPVIALGLVTALTHFLTVMAYQRTEASTLAPFFYFNLVAAIPVGFFWFGEVPGFITLSGLALIVLGGLVSLISPQMLQKLLRNEINSLRESEGNRR